MLRSAALAYALHACARAYARGHAHVCEVPPRCNLCVYQTSKVLLKKGKWRRRGAAACKSGGAHVGGVPMELMETDSVYSVAAISPGGERPLPVAAAALRVRRRSRLLAY